MRKRSGRLAANRDIVGQLLQRRDRRRVGVSGIGHAAPRRDGLRFMVLAAVHACNKASPAIQAVSARRMRGPSDTAATKGCARSASSSAGVKPPSGPTSSAARPVRRHDDAARYCALRRQTGGGSDGQSDSRAASGRGWCRCGTVSRSDCSAASMAIAVSRSALIRCVLQRSVMTGAGRQRRVRSPSGRQDRWRRASAARMPATDRDPGSAARVGCPTEGWRGRDDGLDARG